MQFKQYHPAINFAFFAAAVGLCIGLRHPVYLLISWLVSFVWSVKLRRGRGLRTGLLLLPAAALFAGWYAFYHHFGATVLRKNFIGNRVTLESLVYGAVLGLTVAASVQWMECVFEVFTTDKVVYLFGRISPRLSLFLSLVLRAVPRTVDMARKIDRAQKGIGRGRGQGNLIQRTRNFFRRASILITWFSESVLQSGESMRARGSGLRGRSAYSLYRFDDRDRVFIVVLFSLLTITVCGLLLDQAYVLFDPEIRWIPPAPLSAVFWGAYFFLCSLPMLLEFAAEARYRRLTCGIGAAAGTQR